MKHANDGGYHHVGVPDVGYAAEGPSARAEHGFGRLLEDTKPVDLVLQSTEQNRRAQQLLALRSVILVHPGTTPAEKPSLYVSFQDNTMLG